MGEVCLVKGFEVAQVDAVGVCMTPLEGLKGSMFKKKNIHTWQYAHCNMQNK